MKKLNEYMNEMPFSLQTVVVLSRVLNSVLPDLYFDEKSNRYEFKLEAAEAINKLSFSKIENDKLEEINDLFNKQIISSAMYIIDKNKE